MASNFYATAVPGATLGSVTKAASTQGTNIELRVDTGTTGDNKVEVLKAIEAIKDFITTDVAPA